MRQEERDYLNTIKEEYRPLSAWGFFGYSFLFSLPFIGFIALVVCALSNDNICRRNFARGYFCTVIVVVVVIASLIGAMIGLGLINGIFNGSITG